MAVIPPNNDSENTKVIIGKLIEKADTAIRPVISAFNCLHSRSVNVQRLNQFTVGILENCAEFLGISLADTDNFKIFTKPSLANRLYLGFMALMPAKCGECGEDYVIEHEPEDMPFFNCFKCFKGSHYCERNKELHQTLSAMNTPAGFVWLCNTCHALIDPIEPRKLRSRHTSSADSQIINSATDISSLTHSNVMSSTQNPTSNISSSSSATASAAAVTDYSRQAAGVCQEFMNWSCPHGISGKKKINGNSCIFTHPRVCNQYRTSGFTGKRGCKEGKNCTFFHPDICRAALEHGLCSKKDCLKFHPRSTRKNTNDQRPGREERPKGTITNANQRSSNRSSNSDANTSDFLELRNLVTGMAAKLEALEKKLDQGTPSQACQTVAQPMGASMIYPVQSAPPMMSLGVPRLPHHQIPFSPHSYY